MYTMGTRAYAEEVCAAIDPDQKIFGGRILSRDESGSECTITSAMSPLIFLRPHAKKFTTTFSVRYIYGRHHRRSGRCLGMESKPDQSYTLWVSLDIPRRE